MFLQNFFNYILKIVIDISDSLLLFFYPIQKIEKNKKNVLLIRIDRLGDFILWLDTAKEFKTIYPENDYHITLIGNKLWQNIADNLPFWDETLFIDYKKLKSNLIYRWKIFKLVRMKNFDIVINPTYSREYFRSDSIVRATQAPIRIGFDGDLSNITKELKKKGDSYYTKLISSNKTVLMELERNGEFIKEIGAKNFKCNLPEITVTQNESISGPEHPYFIICPGASFPQKQWPVKNFSQIADRLAEKTNWHGIICGTKNEKSLAKQIQKNCKTKLLNYTGKLSLSKLAILLNSSKLVISNDSGTAHLASALSVLCICILGGGHFGRFFPYKIQTEGLSKILPVSIFYKMECFNCNWECAFKLKKNQPFPCMDKVTVDDVWIKVERLLLSNSIKK